MLSVMCLINKYKQSKLDGLNQQVITAAVAKGPNLITVLSTLHRYPAAINFILEGFSFSLNSEKKNDYG